VSKRISYIVLVKNYVYARKCVKSAEVVGYLMEKLGLDESARHIAQANTYRSLEKLAKLGVIRKISKGYYCVSG